MESEESFADRRPSLDKGGDWLEDCSKEAVKVVGDDSGEADSPFGCAVLKKYPLLNNGCSTHFIKSTV